MKKIYLHTLIIITIISLIVLSCGDMDSIHEDYLQGEQVYAGKLDTLKIRPGYYRAQLEGQTQFLGNSTKIIIEHDDEFEIYDIVNGDYLTEHQKKILFMRLMGKTQNDIAEHLGITQSAVHKAMHGNIDYKNQKKRYGGIIKKLQKICKNHDRVNGILAEIAKINRGEDE